MAYEPEGQQDNREAVVTILIGPQMQPKYPGYDAKLIRADISELGYHVKDVVIKPVQEKKNA